MKKKRILYICCVVILLTIAGYFAAKAFMRSISFWESSIVAFEQQDQKKPPVLGGVVFTGSSSINYWSSLQEDMKPLPVLNRGFGGSYMHHLTHFSSRIILCYQPKVVVIYCGENDIADSISPLQVRNEFEKLVNIIHSNLPKTKIIYVSIKPPILRSLWRKSFAEANQKIEEFTTKKDNVFYVDIVSAMLDKQGKVRSELFTWDRIHINAKGYQLWTSIIKPQIIRVMNGKSLDEKE
ncbi:GDSL-type esterase/lipase family protein [Candidatus Uabimicrobium amorphum]|uniref:SGNH hydrolase-type esterase domain-containing protein n=1 Tax=Uabimicrobium amorphum TaxID=2596890 RepID=A0A5S9F5Q9_UABAM|nr:GDSL-type esterase/lipase family protein [Candidatus Uabimicrobium amorphum]BBM86882.1 hypothetical protein UABAM_05284 [Candidatus Uabimicrobium amorphum]